MRFVPLLVVGCFSRPVAAVARRYVQAQRRRGRRRRPASVPLVAIETDPESSRGGRPTSCWTSSRAGSASSTRWQEELATRGSTSSRTSCPALGDQTDLASRLRGRRRDEWPYEAPPTHEAKFEALLGGRRSRSTPVRWTAGRRRRERRRLDASSRGRQARGRAWFARTEARVDEALVTLFANGAVNHDAVRESAGGCKLPAAWRLDYAPRSSTPRTTASVGLPGRRRTSRSSCRPSLLSAGARRWFAISAPGLRHVPLRRR